MATHYSIFASRKPWTEEHDGVTKSQTQSSDFHFGGGKRVVAVVLFFCT